MSKYTTELRYICESLIGLQESTEYQSVASVITQAAPLLFDFNFPIFNEDYRIPFEEKIIRHFYMREIGLETVGLFKLKLQEKLMLIMPYYNKLYESELLQFNPLYDVDRWESSEGETNASSSATSSNSSDSNTANNSDALDKVLDTPQNNLELLLSGSYLTSASQTNAESSSATNSSGKRDDASNSDSRNTYVKHVSGKQGSSSFAMLLKEYRDTLINTDALVMEELEELFLQLW